MGRMQLDFGGEVGAEFCPGSGEIGQQREDADNNWRGGPGFDFGLLVHVFAEMLPWHCRVVPLSAAAERMSLYKDSEDEQAGVAAVFAAKIILSKASHQRSLRLFR